MTNKEAFSLLKKSLDNMAKALEGFYNDWNALPKYLRNEMLHPKKTKRKYQKKKEGE